MDRAKWYITVILTCIFLGVPGYALRAYQEKVIPQGKIIFGMGEEEALNKYGLPDSKSEKLWHYSSPENIYVYVNKSPGVYLYPRFYKGYGRGTHGAKVFSGLQDIGDATSKSNFILSNPDAFNLVGQGVLVPKKAGDYQVIATYKGVYSNASFVSISESEKETETEQEKLVAIDIFPYKPYVNPGTKVYFCAFGTFVFKGSYSVREITRQAEWLSEQNGVTSRLQDSEITLASPGEYKVFCRYRPGHFEIK